MMPDDCELRADRYRGIARELRVLAFRNVPFDLCRREQLFALAKGFDDFADRIERADRKVAVD